MTKIRLLGCLVSLTIILGSFTDIFPQTEEILQRNKRTKVFNELEQDAFFKISKYYRLEQAQLKYLQQIGLSPIEIIQLAEISKIIKEPVRSVAERYTKGYTFEKLLLGKNRTWKKDDYFKKLSKNPKKMFELLKNKGPTYKDLYYKAIEILGVEGYYKVIQKHKITKNVRKLSLKANIHPDYLLRLMNLGFTPIEIADLVAIQKFNNLKLGKNFLWVNQNINIDSIATKHKIKIGQRALSIESLLDKVASDNFLQKHYLYQAIRKIANSSLNISFKESEKLLLSGWSPFQIIEAALIAKKSGISINRIFENFKNNQQLLYLQRSKLQITDDIIDEQIVYTLGHNLANSLSLRDCIRVNIKPGILDSIKPDPDPLSGKHMIISHDWLALLHGSSGGMDIGYVRADDIYLSGETGGMWSNTIDSNHEHKWSTSGNTIYVDPYHAMDAGDLDGDGKDEIIVLEKKETPDDVGIFHGCASMIQIFSPYKRFFENSDHEATKYYLDRNAIDVSTCDINGDGRDEIVVITHDGFAKIIDTNGASGYDSEWHDLGLGHINYVSAGDLNGDVLEEIILNVEHNKIGMWEPFTSNSPRIIVGRFESVQRLGDLSCGDFNGDGISDIAIASWRESGGLVGDWKTFIFDYVEFTDNYEDCQVEVFDCETETLISYKSGFSGNVIESGDLDFDGIDEVVYFSRTGNGSIGIWDIGYPVVDEGNVRPTPLAKEKNLNRNKLSAVTVGNWWGWGLEVGEPYISVQELHNQPVALLNAPPKQEGVNNNDENFCLEYEAGYTEEEQFQVQSICNSTMSLKFKFGISKGIVKVKENFLLESAKRIKRWDQVNHKTKFSSSWISGSGDRRFALSTAVEIFEYPIISPPELAFDPETGEQFYFLVMIPDGAPTPGYPPYISNIHCTGRLLSYPRTKTDLLEFPTGISSLQLEGFDFYVDPYSGAQTYSLSWESLTEEGVQTESRIKTRFEADFEVGSDTFGIGFETVGEGYQETIETHIFKWGENTSIKAKLKQHLSDNDKRYLVRLCTYYGKMYGFLCVDWIRYQWPNSTSDWDNPECPWGIYWKDQESNPEFTCPNPLEE